MVMARMATPLAFALAPPAHAQPDDRNAPVGGASVKHVEHLPQGPRRGLYTRRQAEQQ